MKILLHEYLCIKTGEENMANKKQRKTFLSYSRVNSDFAKKLAKELKAEGFPVWLDQLDIPLGARWDVELEKALDESEIFMIIMTPDSISSENVRDEIGYAIDNGKRFLPIMLENCNVPLRLRRFQYVDFSTKSFEDGVESAKQLLRGLIAQDTIPRGKLLDDNQSQVTQAEADRKTKKDADVEQKTKEESDHLTGDKVESDRFKASRENVIKASDLLAQGRKLFESKDWVNAAEKLRQVLVITPNHAETKKLLADAEAQISQERDSLDRKNKENEESFAQAKAEAERKAKQESDRLAAQKKAESDRKAREEAERLAAQKAESERVAKQQDEAVRFAQAKSETDRKVREEAERRLNTQREEAVRLAQAKADTERKAREEAERRLASQKVESESLSKPVPKKSRVKGLVIGGIVVIILCIVGIVIVFGGGTTTTPPPTDEPVVPTEEPPMPTDEPVACPWESTQPVKVYIDNQFGPSVEVFWLDCDYVEQHRGTIDAGGAMELDTYVTHVWIFLDSQTGELIYDFQSDGNDYVAIPSGGFVDTTPRIYNFQACIDPCNGQNSSTVFDASVGINEIYIQFDYENFDPGAQYTRSWTNRGDEWIKYTCAWDGPSAGTEMFKLTEPGGLANGVWEVTITVNDTVMIESFELTGTWDFWEPVPNPINKCRQ
jgi:hypothetical protein